MSMTASAIDDFLKRNCIPRGYKYTLVLASITKRILLQEMPESYRFEFLRHLEKMVDTWLTPEMIAALDPMDDKGEEVAREIRKVGPNKALDVYADTFVLLASLNPSLIEVLKMLPGCQCRNEAMIDPAERIGQSSFQCNA